MKRFLFVLSLILFLGVFSPNSINAAYLEKITDYTSNIVVNKDASSEITETITTKMQAGGHGIFWTYPYIYNVKSFQRPTVFNVNSVCYFPRGSQSLSKCGQYERSDSNGWVKLQIGDPDTTLNAGEYIYVIKYTLKYTGVSYFDNNDEYYLNIVGPGWEVPIDSVNATITLPGGIQKVVCYTGPDGSTKSNCLATYEGNILNVSTTTPLATYEGITFAAELPKGSFDDTRAAQRWFIILGNIPLLLPIPVGIVLWGVLKKKWSNKKITIIPHYEPDKDLDPVSAGILYKNNNDVKFISAGLIYLAIAGYLKISKIKRKKYEIIKTEKPLGDVSVHLSSIYSAIFAFGDVVPLSKLTNFYTVASAALVLARKYLEILEYYSVKYTRRKDILLFIGIAISFLTLSFGGVFSSNSLMGTFFGILISGILIFIFALGLDSKTTLGNEKYYELLGLKMYINTAEEKRIEFHNDPAKSIEIFETLLPYAMIFGLEKKWAKEFEDIYTVQPDWYMGDFNTFNAYYLANSLSSFNSATKSVSTPPYSSSGGNRSSGWSSGGSGFSGGSSGGGGGGSGGGGW